MRNATKYKYLRYDILTIVNDKLIADIVQFIYSYLIWWFFII